MTAEAVMQWAKVLAVVSGVGIGVFAVYSPSWVWFRKQLFGAGGGVLCAFGTILIVASLFQSISLVSDGTKLEFRLDQIQKQIERELQTTRAALSETQASLQNVRVAVQQAAAPGTQVAELQKEIARVSTQLATLEKQTSAQVLLTRLDQLANTTAELNTTVKTLETNSPAGWNVGWTIPMVRRPNAIKPGLGTSMPQFEFEAEAKAAGEPKN